MDATKRQAAAGGNRSTRMERLEARLDRLEAGPGHGWKVLQVLMPLLQALILALTAYLLTGRLTTAIEERRLDLSNVTAMSKLLLDLQRPEANRDELESVALTVATFGDYAIAPLVQVIEVAGGRGSILNVLAAENGLRAIGWQEAHPVCERLTAVIENRTQMFGWHTHLSAIRVLGDLGCSSASPALVRYRMRISSGSLIEALPAFAGLVRERNPPSLTDLKSMREQLDLCLRQIARKDQGHIGDTP